MSLNNFIKTAGMLINPSVIKFFRRLDKDFRKDKNYSFINFMKSNLRMIKGEKIVRFDNKYIISSFLPPFPSNAFLNTIYAVDNMKDLYQKTAYFKKTAPISIFLCLTDRCRYNCVHCSAKGRKRGEEVSTEVWIRTIKELQEMGTGLIGLTGGEPLLREDLEEIIRSADDRSVIYVYTSGDGLTKERAKSLKSSGAFAVGISLDSADPEKHNSIRRNKDAFTNSVKAIENSRKVGLYTMVQTLVLKSGVDREELLILFISTY